MEVLHESIAESAVGRAAGSGSPDPIRTKIESFAGYEEGWMFGGGTKADASVVKRALKLYDRGRTLGLRVDAYLTGDGDITLTFRRRDRELEVGIYADETTYEMSLERDTDAGVEEESYSPAIGMAELIRSMFRLAGIEWNWRDSSILTTSAGTISTARASRLMVEEFRSSISSAYGTSKGILKSATT